MLSASAARGAAAPQTAGLAATAGAAGNPAPASTGAAAAPLSPEQRLVLPPEGIRKLESKQGIESPQVKGLTAHIASVSRNGAGRQLFTLDNGQVWRQAESKASFEAGPGDAVTISSGALGSFWLATGKHNRTRVERLP